MVESHQRSRNFGRLLVQPISSRSLGWRLIRIVSLVLIGLVVLIMTFEDRFIYFPAKFPEGFWDVGSLPRAQGEIFPEIQDCEFASGDGVKLHGWFCTPAVVGSGATKAEMTMLWLHGNAGNISHRYEIINRFVKIPVNVFIIDYRGYGKSEGKPSEEGLYRDAQGAWDFLVNDLRIPPDRIVVFGKSLGGAIAIDLATRIQPAGLIVQSSFSSAADMAATVMPLLPKSLLHHRLDSVSRIEQVSCRKLFIHSQADEIVPFRLGKKLFDAAPEPKEFYEVKNAPHNETCFVGGAAYIDKLREFIQSGERRQ